MIALREGVRLTMTGDGEAGIEAEVKRLIQEHGYSDSEAVRGNIRKHVLTARGIITPESVQRLRRVAGWSQGATPQRVARHQVEDRFAEVAERALQRADAERREKRSRAKRPRAIPYDFAPVPGAWYQIARHFPAKADRLLVLLCWYWWRFKWECFPTLRSLAARTGYSRQTIEDLLAAFEYVGILRKGKRPSGNREVKQRNLYRFRRVSVWNPERARGVRAFLYARRQRRKSPVPERAAVG